MWKIINTLYRDERGVSALEYALIAGIVVAAVLVAGSSLTTNIPALFTNMMSNLSTKISAALH
ncbi:Flp family type IVb pilin [Paraburkholderia acidisoli]|uniref:Flp family type IVb pilin n=1 Tax=Paraburkholderia acidisoli TaxID=2571748 RepID=A0A7Z2GKY6_9BURK|nr:Flp family type IVb pilin [Paraburkholderia acidisoli]QGZ63400.1 Flp family type IVb pilin [Paraburkholderia acidisoli]